MIRKFLKISLCLFLIFFIGLSWASNEEYIVKPGDTIISILKKQRLYPIYGKNSSLIKTVKLNEELRKSKGNLIFPKQIIYLPREKEISPPTILVDETPTSTEKSSIGISQDPIANEAQNNNDQSLEIDESANITTKKFANSSFELSSGFSFFRINGNDKLNNGESKILSNLNTNFSANWKVQWDKALILHTTLNVTQFSLQKPTTNRVFTKEDGSLYGFSFYVEKEYSPPLSWGYGLEFQESLFFHSQSVEVISTDKLLISSPMVFSKYHYALRENANLGILGQANLLIQNSNQHYKVKNGLGILFGNYLNYQFSTKNEKSLQSMLYYSWKDQSTSLSTQQTTNLGIKLSFEWKL